MNRNNSLPVTRIGQPKEPWADLYHKVHTLSWGALFTLFLVTFLSLNCFFTLLFVLGGDCIVGADPNSFADRFFFSVQSLTTIGYGVMSPKTTYANILVTCEAFVGIFSTAMMTGMLFAKFSLPKTRVLFADSVLFAQRDGKESLLFRMANGRGNGIVSFIIEVALIIDGATPEGENVRRIIPVPLVLDKVPILSISFLGVHVIDENSPFFGLSLEEVRSRHAVLVVTVSGTDDTIGQSVHAQYFYRPQNFRRAAGFADVLTLVEDDNDFHYEMDYSKLHDVRE